MPLRWLPTNLSDIFDEDFNIPTMPILNRLGQGLNIYETEKAFVAQAAMPGVPEDTIDVTINDNGVVTISGSNQEQQKDTGQRKYYMSSLSTAYNYSFKLPSYIAGNQEPSCDLDNGVLTLTFPKEQPTPPKKIKVNAKGKSTQPSQEGIGKK